MPLQPVCRGMTAGAASGQSRCASGPDGSGSARQQAPPTATTTSRRRPPSLRNAASLFKPSLGRTYLVLMLLEWAGGSWILRRLYSVTAVGKLGVVLAEGRPPRPVVDSSVSGVTSITSLPNRSVNPTLADLFLSMPLSDSRERLVALILNVAKAHRRILIRACDRVLLCFRHRKKLYQYVTLNFGARVSSYYFALLESVSAPLWASLVAVLLVLKVPLSWRKAALSPQVVWIGWELKLDLSCFCVRLDPGKISRLCALLRDALRSRRCSTHLLDNR